MNEAELRSLLDRGAAAIEPSAQLPARALAAGRRRLRRRRAASAGAVLAVLLAVAVVVPGVAGRERPAVVLGGSALAPQPGTWSQVTEAPLAGRLGHTATWTGAELVVWGGWAPPAVDAFADGAALDPATGSWRVLTPTGLAPRRDHVAVWSGSQLLVWGGTDGDRSFADGAAYDPEADAWQALPQAPLEPRSLATAVWTGGELVVFGGIDAAGEALGDGAAYSPETGTWRRIAAAGGPRRLHQAVWTGSEMVVLGGLGEGLEAAEPGLLAYDPVGDAWSERARIPRGIGRIAGVVAWSGDEVLVAGGDPLDDAGSSTATSAAYDPATDTWRVLRGLGLAPVLDAVGGVVDGWFVVQYGTTGELDQTGGAAYSLSEDRWVDTGEGGPLAPRSGLEAAVTGDVLIAWGGADTEAGGHFADGAAYRPPASPPAQEAPATTPAQPSVRLEGAPTGPLRGDQVRLEAGADGALLAVTADATTRYPADGPEEILGITLMAGATADAVRAVVHERDAEGSAFRWVTGPADDLRFAPMVAPDPTGGRGQTPVSSPDGDAIAWLSYASVASGGILQMIPAPDQTGTTGMGQHVEADLPGDDPRLEWVRAGDRTVLRLAGHPDFAFGEFSPRGNGEYGLVHE